LYIRERTFEGRWDIIADWKDDTKSCPFLVHNETGTECGFEPGQTTPPSPTPAPTQPPTTTPPSTSSFAQSFRASIKTLRSNPAHFVGLLRKRCAAYDASGIVTVVRGGKTYRHQTKEGVAACNAATTALSSYSGGALSSFSVGLAAYCQEMVTSNPKPDMTATLLKYGRYSGSFYQIGFYQYEQDSEQTLVDMLISDGRSSSPFRTQLLDGAYKAINVGVEPSKNPGQIIVALAHSWTDKVTTTTTTTTTTTKAPATTSKAPATTTKAPATTSKAPATTSKAPVSTTKAPVSTTKAPATTQPSRCPSSNAARRVTQNFSSVSGDTLPSGFWRPSSKLKWRLRSFGTPTRSTGPSADHTTGDRDGKYLYMEASKVAQGDKAKLGVCYRTTRARTFSFWYSMYGSHMGTLRVKQTQNGCRTYQKTLFRKSGNQGQSWKKASVQVQPSNGRVCLQFIAIRGSGFRSDIAIDDIRLS